MKFIVNPSTLSGSIWIPPSKSHTMRAILFASLAKGKSRIQHYLPSPDTVAMIHACRMIGAEIEVNADELLISGVTGKPKTPDNIIDAGNSGQVLRFIAAVAALTDGYTIITGDESIRTKRPMQPLLDGLTQLNGLAVSSKNDGYAPIIIKGPIKPGKADILGTDSQPVSALLIGTAFLNGRSEIVVREPGEKPWIDLTLNWFNRLGIAYQAENYSRYVINGNAAFAGFNYAVPGDFSSAAFPLAAALITGSEITLENVDMNDIQGDKALILALENMGAAFEYDEQKKQLHVKKSTLTGGKANINDYIDAAPIMAVIGCFMQEGLQISGAEIARHKESDRLKAIKDELEKMGGELSLLQDGLKIKPKRLHGAQTYSYHDHRLAMSLAVAGLAAEGATIIDDVTCVTKSFPGFAEAMQGLGANIQESQ